MADKVYLTPTSGSWGHRGGETPVNCCPRKRSGGGGGGGDRSISDSFLCVFVSKSVNYVTEITRQSNQNSGK